MSFWKEHKQNRENIEQADYAIDSHEDSPHKKRLKEVQGRLKIAQEKDEIRRTRREIRDLEHPYRKGTSERAKSIGGRILQAGYGLAKEGARTYNKTNQTLKNRRIRIQRSRIGRPSFSQPSGMDTSLSGSIARNDWHNRSIMEMNFYGNENQNPLQPPKELLGSKHNMDTLTGFGNNNNTDYLGSNNKKKNQRLI